MYGNPRHLRLPEERVGTFTNAALPPPVIDDTNFSLVQRLRARDETVFQQLHDLYYSPMLRTAMNFVRSREEAEEVIQETWVAVLRGIDRFEGRSSFKTWMFRILVNRARSRAAREARTITFAALTSADDDAAAPNPVSGSASPEQNVLDGEMVTLLERAVAALPRAQRMVISLRDIEGWSADEVCEALEITQANQRVLLHRARMKVRAELSSYFG